MVVDLGYVLVRDLDGVAVGEGDHNVLVLPLKRYVEEIHLRSSDEARDEFVVRLVVEVHGGVDLLYVAELHNDDAGTHGHGLDLVMGDVDEGRVQALVQRGDLRAHGRAQLCVKVGQRLVKQEYLRVADQSAAECNTLALTAGHCLRLTIQVLLDVEDLRCFQYAFFDLCFGNFAVSQTECHVLVHGHVRIQSVALEHHRDIAILGFHVVNQRIADQQIAGGDRFQAGDHSERSGFTASGRPDENNEFTVSNVDGKIIYRFMPVIIDLVDMGKL